MQSRDGGSETEGLALVVAVLERPAVIGSQVPRIRVVPDGVDHPKWDEIVAFVKRLGVTLDPWQWDVLRVSLMRTTDLERWAAFAVAVCAPRQNGKNGILEIRELIGARILGERLLIHSAHLADTSKEGFRRLDELLEANAWLSAKVKHIWRTNGHEAIEFVDGCRIRFRTRTRGGGRGFSGSPVVFDEAMFLPEVSLGSILPVISAQPDPQIWYMGSAVDQSIHEDGVSFARVRDRAIMGTDPRLAYFEWSMDEESPDDVDEESALDPEWWAATNPALGIRITREYIDAEFRELDLRTFAVERLGVGDWPPVDGSSSQVIPVKVWDALEDDPGSDTARMIDPVCFAVDVRPDRSRSAIVAAGGRGDGRRQLELVEHEAGTGWVAGRVAELKRKHCPVAVLVQGSSPAGSLIGEFAAVGVEVAVISNEDYGKACGAFFDEVEQDKIRHLGATGFRQSVKGASRRAVNDAWSWSRRSSSSDISPLVAATLAVWGLRTAPAPKKPSVLRGHR